MKYLSYLAFVLSLSGLLYSCEDTKEVPVEPKPQTRLKRMYVGNNYLDLFYDESGKLKTLDHYIIEPTGIALRTQHSMLYYDQHGRIERERTEGSEARSVQYHYDAQNRVENVVMTIDGNAGYSGYHYWYDQKDQVSHRQFFVLNETGDTTTLSNDTYAYDDKKNVISSHQIFKSNVTPTFERKATYKYDDKPNPWYGLPYIILKTPGYMNSPYNVTEYSSVETNLPANGNSSYSYTHHFNNKYNNGLLEEQETDMQNNWKFVYETY